MSDIEVKVLFLLRNINGSITDNINDNILDAGIIDSFEIVNIIAALEETFNIEINGEDIIPENFNSIKAIAKLLEKKYL